MAQIVDAFNDAINQDKFLLKTIIYALPVFFCISLYLAKNMVAFFFLGVPTLILLLALLSIGIYNISNNKREILTFNLLSLLTTIIKLFLTITFYFLILFVIGFLVLKYIKIPYDNQYFQMFYKYFVIFFLFSIGFTQYLAFSKKLKMKDAYRFSLIQECSMDVFIALLFMIPQFLIVDGCIVGFVWYICWALKISLSNPLFIFYCAWVVVLNVSALSSYLAQMAYVCISGDDEDYRDNYYIKDNKLVSNKNKR